MNNQNNWAAKLPPTPRLTPWQERPGIAYPFLFILAVILVLPSNAARPLLHDSFAIDWVWADQFTSELARGILYPRWLPNSDGGLGAPVFYYYPPLAFYVSAVFGLLGLSTYASIIATFAAAFFGSGIACWHWLKGHCSQPLLGAAFFVVAPYHLLDYTVRGALAESVAIGLIPVVAIGLRRIAERRGGKILTAISYGAMIGSHLPLALLVSVFLIAPTALAARRQMVHVATAAALGIALSAVYLVPALALEPFHDVGQLYRTPNLQTAYWAVYNGHWSDPTFTMVMFIIVSILFAAALPALRRRDGWAQYSMAMALLVSGIIPLLWSMPLLQKVQFPYRALPLAEFGLATALARLPRRELLAKLFFLLPLLLSIMIVPGFHIPGDNLARLRTLHPDVYEYLPRGVMKRGQTKARLADILAARVPPPKVAGMVVEDHFYFPSWSCGEAEPRTQLLIHSKTCHPRLVLTKPEKLGLFVSIVAGSFLGLMAWLASVTNPAVLAARFARIMPTSSPASRAPDGA
ncbi:MAG TPA: hypothetical protein VE968_01260 [Sphingomicrobium sp.]|nr:hypothetical protein [Sphingomicrobium sp.]